jgi:hypothetical protein
VAGVADLDSRQRWIAAVRTQDTTPCRVDSRESRVVDLHR